MKFVFDNKVKFISKENAVSVKDLKEFFDLFKEDL